VLAAASFAALQRLHVPVYYAMSVGALLGMAWRLAGF